MILPKAVCGVALSLLLIGCGSGGPKGWTLKGDLDGKTLYVEADPKIMTSFDRYQDAVDDVCSGDCAMVEFYQPGDTIPSAEKPAREFKHSTPAVVWALGKFTSWDCDRAPSTGVPVSYGCGEGGREFEEAIADIALRDGWVIGCKMTAFNGYPVVQAYATTIKDEDRRKQLLERYRSTYQIATSPPDNPAFCGKQKAKFEENAINARKKLEVEIKRAG